MFYLRRRLISVQNSNKTMPLQYLPNWLQLVAFLLALNAGMINVLGLITILHQSVSHMTGNISILAISLVDHQTQLSLYLVVAVLCYVLGSFISGFTLGTSHFSLNKQYGIPLTLVTCALLLCWLLLSLHTGVALLWACLAMGIQNAMVSYYKGIIIRTTHLSGVLTDIGLMLGYLLRGLRVEKRRIMLHILIVLGFTLGGIFAALIYPSLKLHAFFVPALISLLMSIVYWYLYVQHNVSSQKVR